MRREEYERAKENEGEERVNEPSDGGKAETEDGPSDPGKARGSPSPLAQFLHLFCSLSPQKLLSSTARSHASQHIRVSEVWKNGFSIGKTYFTCIAFHVIIVLQQGNCREPVGGDPPALVPR